MFNNLRELNLSRNKIGAKGCQHIFEGKNSFRCLLRLNLKECGLNSESVEYLSATKCLQNLQSLNLGYNEIGDSGCEIISQSNYLTNLKRLILNECQIKELGVRFLAASKNFRTLEILNLAQNQGITNASADLLSESRDLPMLKDLDLEGCSLTIKGIQKLCMSRSLARLRRLKIFGDNIGKLVAEELKAEMGITKNLELN